MSRLARGSVPPERNTDTWIAEAVRARFSKLAVVLGEKVFETMLADYFSREPEARTSVKASGELLAGFLSSSPDYPVWYGELAAIDRAHVEVAGAKSVPTMGRRELTHERALQLVPAHALLLLTTATDELWMSL